MYNLLGDINIAQEIRLFSCVSIGRIVTSVQNVKIWYFAEVLSIMQWYTIML